MPALISWWTDDLTVVAPDAFPDAVHAVGGDLLERWSEPHRHYHGTRHLVEVFWALEELETAGELDARQGALARVAAWFHDAVYDPSADTGVNEADSALLAHGTLTELGVEDDDVDAVVRLVRVTDAHACGEDPLEHAFHDADLWILAAEPERFDAYCAQIRAEYAAVPDAAYATGRAEVLRAFARRERLYRTDHARDQWEPTARVNLERELERLGAPEVDVQ